MGQYSNYYLLLEIPEDSTEEQIRTAYRKLSKEYHPDLHGNSPEYHSVFIMLSNAYRVLVDVKKREEYDTYLKTSSSYKSSRKNGTVLPGRRGEIYRTNEQLLDHLNYIIWDIEDIVTGKSADERKYREIRDIADRYILKILVFIDKWLLSISGFKDYFMEARKLNDLDPEKYYEIIMSSDLKNGHHPFVNIHDYFYNIRKRTDKFLTKTGPSDMMKVIDSSGLRLIDCIIETQNMAVYYIAGLMKILNDEKSTIAEYEFSNDRFYGKGKTE